MAVQVPLCRPAGWVAHWRRMAQLAASDAGLVAR